LKDAVLIEYLFLFRLLKKKKSQWVNMVLHFVLKQITHALNVKFEAAVLKKQTKKNLFYKVQLLRRYTLFLHHHPIFVESYEFNKVTQVYCRICFYSYIIIITLNL